LAARLSLNVSYYKSYSYTAYEFDISEGDFVAWSSRNLKPITKPVTIYRYSHMTKPRIDPGPNASYQSLKEALAVSQADISDGLYYEHVQSNGGGMRMAYDRIKRRAYVQTSPR
jgi:hypothetical protein